MHTLEQFIENYISKTGNCTGKLDSLQTQKMSEPQTGECLSPRLQNV